MVHHVRIESVQDQQPSFRMSEPGSTILRRTVLHDWHVRHQARIVPFGGWGMPVQYATGITREHIATRTHAGLFDVCHMGRFRIVGADCEAFLSGVLTNDPSVLNVGEAHYTLLANEHGGALDDAYLYRLAAREFLLVVNASNRQRDWDWLHARPVPAFVQIKDDSESTAMLALQGPQSSAILETLLDPRDLPEPRRNRLRAVQFGRHGLIVARTGYTGEVSCFELFAAAEVAVELWQRLVDAGAVPVGLGARDSLRLEAGLPLYGHELGLDAQGNDIPIFANTLARFGVRRPGRGAYMGSTALDAQRAEYEAIAADTLRTPVEERLLQRLVRPIAVFDGRRPLRAGYELFLNDERVGYVTSGTSVPVAAPGARLDQQHDMRPIGLALIRSDIRFRPDQPTTFVARDDRGGSMTAELVERNLPVPKR
jgi:aminomethyltransferase